MRRPKLARDTVWLASSDGLFYVEKGGEIIPKIVGIDFDKRPTNSIPFQYITNCPECNAPLERQEGEANHYCVNENGCATQIKGKIQHFIARKAMNIDGLGTETIVVLYDNGLIKNISEYLHKIPIKFIPQLPVQSNVI
jgi:DNA ligase (NAD+)